MVCVCTHFFGNYTEHKFMQFLEVICNVANNGSFTVCSHSLQSFADLLSTTYY